MQPAMLGAMEMLDILRPIGPIDLAALGFLIVASVGIGWLIESARVSRISVTRLMSEYHREWMRQLTKRNNRIMDAQVLVSLRQGSSFFASTALLALGALLALIGNPQPLAGVAEGLVNVAAPAQLLQAKLLVVALFLANAFLRFVWANRVFGYASVVMAAVPDDPADPGSTPRAAQTAELNIRGMYNFNRGLRSMYFALAALGWLLGAQALAIATLIVLWLLWSREFMSGPHEILKGGK